MELDSMLSTINMAIRWMVSFTLNHFGLSAHIPAEIAKDVLTPENVNAYVRIYSFPGLRYLERVYPFCIKDPKKLEKEALDADHTIMNFAMKAWIDSPLNPGKPLDYDYHMILNEMRVSSGGLIDDETLNRYTRFFWYRLENSMHQDDISLSDEFNPRLLHPTLMVPTLTAYIIASALCEDTENAIDSIMRSEVGMNEFGMNAYSDAIVSVATAILAHPSKRTLNSIDPMLNIRSIVSELDQHIRAFLRKCNDFSENPDFQGIAAKLFERLEAATYRPSNLAITAAASADNIQLCFTPSRHQWQANNNTHALWLVSRITGLISTAPESIKTREFLSAAFDANPLIPLFGKNAPEIELQIEKTPSLVVNLLPWKSNNPTCMTRWKIAVEDHRFTTVNVADLPPELFSDPSEDATSILRQLVRKAALSIDQFLERTRSDIAEILVESAFRAAIHPIDMLIVLRKALTSRVSRETKERIVAMIERISSTSPVLSAVFHPEQKTLQISWVAFLPLAPIDRIIAILEENRSNSNIFIRAILELCKRKELESVKRVLRR